MKKVIETFYYDTGKLEEQGFVTDAQKAALGCAAELITEIKNSAKQPFGMAIFFITEADMLGDRPVTVWSGFEGSTNREIFEDYMLKRLKMKEQQTTTK